MVIDAKTDPDFVLFSSNSSRPTHAFASGERSVSPSSSFMPGKNLSPYLHSNSTLIPSKEEVSTIELQFNDPKTLTGSIVGIKSFV